MTHDVIVIGAGPAGSVAALLLSRAEWRVAIVEKSEFPRRKVCGEYASATNLVLLDRLGVIRSWHAQAGPQIRRVGFFAGETCIEAAMPPAGNGTYGRALGRDILDELLLDAAVAAGAEVFQPWQAVAIERAGDVQSVTITAKDRREAISAPVIVAAHGSWEPGSLPSQAEKDNRPSDLLGFKAHFTNAALPADLMPLLVFPGGYGGMVWADHGRLSLSCCIRREHLTALRAASPGASAAETLQNHLAKSCRGIREALHGAGLDGRWLAAGPMRPGIRARYEDDIFRVGNAAGESHSIIAEGVSMAMQSGWMLAGELLRADVRRLGGRELAGRRYAAAWNSQFAMRIHAADTLARIAMQPGSARLMRSMVERFPGLLTIGARLSGKTKKIPGLAPSRNHPA